MGHIFKVGDKVQTKEGNHAKIVAFLKSDTLSPMIVIVDYGYEERVERYTPEGKWFVDTDDALRDLVSVPKQHTFKHRLYEHVNTKQITSTHSEMPNAELHGFRLLAIKEVTYTEGEGL